ncbi:MAG: thioesterase domain-containing protein [Rhodococcus sp. (in: high G+C Gram-positive bacteria)]
MTVISDLSQFSFVDIADRAPRASSTVLSIRAGGTRSPVFCIHSIDGRAGRYAALAAHIDGDRPVYGVETSASVPRASSVSALAERYADDILAVRGNGPINLLGVSFGGLLAHAVAVALQLRGLAVNSLALLGSSPVQSRCESADEPAHELLAGIGADVDRSRAEELVALATDHQELAKQHFPGVYRGKALVVSTVGSDAGAAWHAFVSGTVSKYEVPDASAFGLVGPLVNRHL